MKILVCGLGSIGERHLGNLLSLGYNDIVVYRKRNLPLRSLCQTFPTFHSLAEALNEKPDVAFICNPTHLHLTSAISCIKAGCHVFVEKPLSGSSMGLEELATLAEQKSLQLMVGYMMRFHPCLQKIQQWLTTGLIGRLVYVRSQWGEYLPDWHPWENYRESYAALKSMGGGPGLTLSHELDTLLWLCGDYSKVISMANYESDLEIDTEHGLDLLVKFKSGVTANVHMDYFQSPPSRSMELVGTKGRIFFDYYASLASLYEQGSPKAKNILDISDSFDRNDLFLLELQCFMDSIRRGVPCKPSVADGTQVIKLLEDALREKI